MPSRPLIELLPEPIREWLNGELLKRGFSGYEELSSLLSEKGYEISKSSVHRYAQGFEEKLSALKIATEQAKAIAETAGDDANLMGDALIRIYQQKIFELLLKLEIGDDPAYNLGQIGKMITQINATSIDQKRYMEEVKKKTAVVADDVVATITKDKGLSDEAAAVIRAKILGIAE